MGGKFSVSKSRETRAKARLEVMEKRWTLAYRAFEVDKASRLMHVSNLMGLSQGVKPCELVLEAIKQRKEDGHGFVLYLEDVVRVNQMKAMMVEQEGTTAAFLDVPRPREGSALHALFKSLGWYSIESEITSYTHYPELSYLFYRAIPEDTRPHYLFIFHEGGCDVAKQTLELVKKSMRGAPQLSVIFANTKST